MRESTKDEIQGKYHEAKGKAKEYIGEAFGKPDVAMEGRIEKTAGKTEKTLGKGERKLEKHVGKARRSSVPER